MVLWILSLASAVGTGWLVFSSSSPEPALHAAFLLSVGGFVACCLWALSRGLAPGAGGAGGDRESDGPAGSPGRGSASEPDDSGGGV